MRSTSSAISHTMAAVVTQHFCRHDLSTTDNDNNDTGAEIVVENHEAVPLTSEKYKLDNV